MMLGRVGTTTTLVALHDFLTLGRTDTVRAHIGHATIQADQVAVIPVGFRVAVHEQQSDRGGLSVKRGTRHVLVERLFAVRYSAVCLRRRSQISGKASSPPRAPSNSSPLSVDWSLSLAGTSSASALAKGPTGVVVTVVSRSRSRCCGLIPRAAGLALAASSAFCSFSVGASSPLNSAHCAAVPQLAA